MDIITLELGHYQLREQIAGSAYGVIWRASGPHGTGDAALKLVNQAQMSRALPAQRERWIACASSEIAFLQSLEPWDERHIVRLLDSGWHEGLPVLALELLDGDLARHMASRPALPPLQALEWTAQLNQALAKVHQYGWRYLDLKPANVLVDIRLGAVKLADFGTNRRLEALHAHTYSGTANWQAPEQFFPAPGGGYATGVQSDYFALGALCYYLLSGGESLSYCTACGQAYRERLADGALALRATHGGIPPTLQPDEEARFVRDLPPAAVDSALSLLRALLAPAPADRPRHALQISRQLAAIRAACNAAAAAGGAIPRLAPATHAGATGSTVLAAHVARAGHGCATHTVMPPMPHFGRPSMRNGWQRL
jgi:serine/threonine protein kinase